jgi:hypothetical protein
MRPGESEGVVLARAARESYLRSESVYDRNR